MSKESTRTAEVVAQAVRETAIATAKTVADAATAAAQLVSAAIVIDIGYIKSDLKEIKDTLKENTKQFVTLSDWITHLKADEIHEARIAKLEVENQTLKENVHDLATTIKIWAASIGFILAILEIILKIFVK